MSVYVISGKDTFRAESYLRYILEQNNVPKGSVTTIDASDRKFRMDAALAECDSFSLFDEGGRAVILKDPSFLSASAKTAAAGKKNESEKDDRLRMLESYLSVPDHPAHLIVMMSGFDADSRKKEYKLFVKYKAVIQKFDRMKDKEFAAYADNLLQKNGIRCIREARRELLERVGTDTGLLSAAIEKILLYGKKEISEEDVRGLVSLNADVNIWKMSDAFISGNLEETMKVKEDMLRNGYDLNAITAMLASRLRTSFYMKRLFENGLSNEEIAVRIQGNAWAVSKNLDKMFRMRSHDVLRLLNELAELDQAVKAGKADLKEGFDLFLLRNGRAN